MCVITTLREVFVRSSCIAVLSHTACLDRYFSLRGQIIYFSWCASRCSSVTFTNKTKLRTSLEKIIHVINSVRETLS